VPVIGERNPHAAEARGGRGNIERVRRQGRVGAGGSQGPSFGHAPNCGRLRGVPEACSSKILYLFVVPPPGGGFCGGAGALRGRGMRIENFKYVPRWSQIIAAHAVGLAFGNQARKSQQFSWGLLRVVMSTSRRSLRRVEWTV
jgi:hypothetical protein